MSNDGDNMIKLHEVTKRFSGLTAVDNLSLTVKQGELFAFLGPNGAGKTTTIKMIVNLLSPSSGSICINGIDMQKESISARRIMSYVPDVPFLYDKLTAYEFMIFVCGIYGVEGGSSQDDKIMDELRRFGISDRKETLIENFSHGMRQRLVFSAALVHDPDLLVIDEPMVGLDPESARLVKDILKELTGRGKTVFMSTHTLSVAEEIADRIGIINKGRLIALGTKEHLEAISGKESGNLEDIFLEITRDKE